MTERQVNPMQTIYSSSNQNRFRKKQSQACHDCERMHTGYTIRRLREIKGLTQGDLAKHADANLSYISLIENHPSNISIEKIHQICNAMAIGMPLFARIVEALDVSYTLQQNMAQQSAYETLVPQRK
jgi:transcriptional regulator with XRE-family HTH domain